MNSAERLKITLKKKGSHECRTMGISMAPLLSKGDLVTIALIKEELKPLDIILFHDVKQDILICHYIESVPYKVTPDAYYQTKGLNNDQADYPIQHSQIIGVVTSHELTLMMKFKIFFRKLIQKD